MTKPGRAAKQVASILNKYREAAQPTTTPEHVENTLGTDPATIKNVRNVLMGALAATAFMPTMGIVMIGHFIVTGQIGSGVAACVSAGLSYAADRAMQGKADDVRNRLGRQATEPVPA